MAQTIQMRDKTSSKFWNIANFDGVNAEITMYGEICDKQPIDWWTGEAEPGEYITPEGFLEDLKIIKNAQNITIKLNSCGGDLYTGLAIHNALKSLKKNITVDVEGVAASAGSIIMCAGDNVRVHVGSIVMIHGVAAELKGYWGLDDLKKQVRSFDTSENAIAEIYSQKTGISVDKLRSMMDKETWMTGREAVEKGFANELIDGEPIQINLVEKSTLMSNGIKLNFAGHTIPNNIIQNTGSTSTGGRNKMEEELQKFLASLKSGLQKMGLKLANASETQDAEGEQKPENKNENQGQEQVPQNNDIDEKIKAAVIAERNRCREIDNLPTNVSIELKNAAKYGNKICNAGELAMFVLQQADPTNANALQKLKNDAHDSGGEKINGSSAPNDNLSEEEKKINEAKQFASERRARKENKKGGKHE